MSAELNEPIYDVTARSPADCEGYRNVFARLRLSGIRTSNPRVFRLMPETGLIAPTQVRRPYGLVAHE